MNMWVGNKIKSTRMRKGISEKDMAERLSISVEAYQDIESDESKDLTMKRLEQIAEILEESVMDLLASQDRISNFFDSCQNTHVSNGNNSSYVTNYYDSRESEHKIEMAQLEMKRLKIEIEKMEWELRYWKELAENKQVV